MATDRYTLIDTHCHLNDRHFAGRVGEVLARAEAVGVSTIVVPGWDRESSLRALALAAAYPIIRPAVGLHPWFVTQDADLSWLPALLDDPRVVAIGEIGLDGAINGADLVRQTAILRTQLQWAVDRDLPVLLHCRQGWDPLLRSLTDTPGVRGVLHAFSGSREILHACLQRGLFISFAAMLTRANSRRAHEAACLVPATRLLLETDAPNMALEGIPAAQAEPAHLPRILAYLAALRGDEPGALAERMSRNAQNIKLI